MELEINGKLEKVRSGGKGKIRFDFPVCTVKRNGSTFIAYLNAAAARILDDMGTVSWYLDENYIICMPSKAINAYKPITMNGKLKGYCIPMRLLQDRIVREGHYKLYRYKSGFGFKKYERLEDAE